MVFENAERRGSEFVNIDLSGVRLRNVDFTGAKVMEAMLVNARFSGLIEGLVVNDVEVGSFAETLRHLVFVTDSWISNTVLDRPGHHPLGMPPSFITNPEALGIDVDASPSIAEVTALREDRMGVVRGLVDDLSDDGLRRKCGKQGEHTVLSCLQTLFDEEWAHNYYANRDLDTLS
jgi:hypothetical protein